MKKQLEDFIGHVNHVMHEMADEHWKTDKRIIKPLTITLEGKTIEFPIAWDTHEILLKLLYMEKENGHHE